MSFVASNISFFGPRQVPGLALWLDASDATTIGLSSNTQNVTQWRDKSRNSNNFQTIQGTPTFIGGSSGVFFSNARTDLMRSLSSNISYTANITNLFVVAMYSNPGNYAYIINFGCNTDVSLRYNGGAAANQNDFYFNTTLSQQIFNLNGTSTNGFTPPVNTINRYNIFSGVYGPSIGGTSSPSFIQLSSAFLGRYLNGFINEVLMYSNALTTLQRQQIEGHLAWKWGLQANLPAGHPYRFNSQQAIYPFTTIQTPFTNIHLPYYSDFSPRSIGGCRLWLDAADTSSVILSNGAITQWNDKSGLSNNATQATASNRPLYSNSFVSLNGVNQFFNVNLDFLAGVSHNSFIVIRNFNYTNIYGAATGGLSSNSLHIGFNSAGSYRMNFWGNDWYPSITANYRVNQTNLLNFNWVHNTSKIIYANGGLEGTSNQAGIIGTMAGGGRIGNVANSTGVFNPAFISANIYEMIIYTGTLTTTQRQQVEGYLSSKWGLLGNLASSNPYRGNIRTLIYPNITISRPPVYSVTRNGVRWTPLEIPVLALWLDAADRGSITLSGSNITNVNDKSGQNVVLSNATGFSYATNLFNGSYPSFYNPNGGRVIGTTARLGRNASFAIGVPFTVFFVGQDITTTDYGYVIDSGPSGLNRPYIYDPRLITLFGQSATPQARSPFQGCSQFYNSPTMFVNGSSVYALGSLTTFTTGGITVGNRFSLNEAWPGHLCEIIIYNRSITTTERQKVEGYLAYKWGLRSSLPTNHPYKNIPVS